MAGQNNPLDDATLMTRLAGGDRAALAALVCRHQEKTLRLAYRITGDWALAEDIVQDAFLRVWRSASRYEPSALFSTWLHRIVVNLCLDAFKKKRETDTLPPGATDDRSPDPAASLQPDERSAAVRLAIAELPQRQRAAVVLHRFEGLSMREIAAVTGWSESAVESLLVRAYATLRSRLAALSEK